MTARRRKRAPNRPQRPALTPAEGSELAAELLRDLTPHVGNPDAVDHIMRTWLDAYDVARFGLIALAAVRLTFAECITYVDPADVPPGALTLTSTEGALTHV